MRILTIDIGNTRASLGCFEDGGCRSRYDISVDELRSGLIPVLQERSDLCVISCVSERVSFILDEIRGMIVSPICEVRSHEAPLVIHYEHPERLGQDRIVNALGAYYHSRTGAIVVDMGTATHFDVVDPAGEFWGGPILAGVETMLQALTQRIPHLPTPPLRGDVDPISQNTLSAIRTGTLLSAAGGVERIVYEIRKHLEFNPRIILTGGNAGYIEPYIAYDEWVPDLTLEGLYEYGIRYLSGMSRISA